MRTSTGTIATACALSAALLVAGCGGDGAQGVKSSGKATKSTGEVFLQPVAAQGPDPFTDSTATAPSAPPRATRTPQSTPTVPTPTVPTSPSIGRTRTVSGATPGLYGGTARTGSCDVERQIAYLTRDRAKAGAFAQAEGISRSAIPGYLRGLTSVVLRADTQVTNHGFRDAQVTGFQSVLQAGTAVLVDDRGVPRVRCACGNPLKAGVAGGNSGSGGRGWSGYRPAEVVVVTPAPQVITNITIVNVVDNTWIERPLGHRGPHHDHVVRPPVHVPSTTRPGTTPVPHGSTSPRPYDSHSSAPTGGTGTPSSGTSTSPGRSPDPLPSATPSASPSEESPTPADGRTAAPDKSTAPCTTPTVTVTPGAAGGPVARIPAPGATGCPTATLTATSGTVAPQPSQDPGSPDGIGPSTVPETPDRPDGGGSIPGDATSSIFDSPTDVFGG